VKILYVTSGFVPQSQGGTELHAFFLAREMAKQHEVLVLTRLDEAELGEYGVRRYEHEGISVVGINYRFSDAQSFEWIYRNPNIDSLFADIAAEFAPDLVHVHHLTCLSTSILEVSRQAGYATVMTLHDFWMVCPRGQRIDPELTICETIDRAKCQACLARLWPHFFPGVDHAFPAVGALEKLAGGEAPAALAAWDAHIARMLEHCHLLLTPSDFHRDKMLEFPIDAERLRSLPHGLDHDLLAARKEADAAIRTVGFIGSVIPSKGVHLLMEAMNLLYRPDVKLNVYGSAPSFHGDTSYVERMLATKKPDVQVEFVGPYAQPDLPMILRDIDVLVVPSLWWESFCLTIREGLLAGCIVVAAAHGPMTEALLDGELGLLFEPGNAHDLCRQLQRLLDEPELAARLRNRGANVKTIEQNAREMLELYRDALERAGKDPGLAHAQQAAPLALAETSGVEAEVPVTVFIPTWNGGPLFRTVLQQIFAQKTDFPFEVLVIDSGSKDETLEIIAEFPAIRLIQIPNSEFNHGLTRNRAVREAKGEIVALLTQDAVPYGDSWLQSLVANFDDPLVAGAYCHQIPREDCNPFQRDRLAGWTYGEGERELRFIESRAQYEAMTPMEKYLTIAFDDVASCVRKSVMRTIPYERRQFGEDVAWSKQAVLAGWKIAMDPRSVVVHSHNNSIWYEFKRVYLDHQNLHELVGMHLVQRFSEVLRFTVAGTRHLGGVIKRADLPWHEKLRWWIKTPFYSLGQNMGQYLGARSVIEKKRGAWGWIDRRLKKGV
jgi:glycosyltransferase involved in cell wall biosynthesis